MYDFRSLSSYDFECLARDLLQKERGFTLESFTPGKDEGIDFRYIGDSDKKTIVQCKHFADSKFATLFSQLKNEELPKLKKLNPTSYILVTSIGLTPPNKDKIKDLFKPFCLSTNDVWGKGDINNRLGKFADIEKKHFKLWLPSVTVLEQIIHSEISNQTKLEIESIQAKLKYYVHNKSFNLAYEILEAARYCVISGIPGIGKTTLANALLFAYIKNGFEPVIINNDISEGFKLYNRESKQIFYYNDFLGQTSFDEKLNKNEDQGILRFIEMVSTSKEKRFILTTREFVLNQAMASYEKLNVLNIDFHKCVIQLSDYTKFEKAKILFNHIYFSELPIKYKLGFLKDKVYLKVINHDNYNPRIIEWITDYSQNIQIKDNEYIPTVLKTLDNPAQLWAHAFENQISNQARCLLITLASFSGSVSLSTLEDAFCSYSEYGAIKYSARDFRKALKETEGNFTKIVKYTEDAHVDFHNPSIRDFLELYLADNIADLKAICLSAKHFDQFSGLWKDKLKEALIACSTEFLDGVRRTFKQGCVYKYKLPIFGREPYYVSLSMLESRIIFVLNVLATMKNENGIALVDLMVLQLLDNINKKVVNKERLVELIEVVSKSRFINQPSIEKLIQVTAKTIINSIYEKFDIENHALFIRIKNTCPDLISDVELEKIRSKFENQYKEDVSYTCSEMEHVDDVENYLKSIKDVSEYFELDAHDEICVLESRINELNSENTEEPYPGDYHYDEASGSDKEIDILFSYLE